MKKLISVFLVLSAIITFVSAADITANIVPGSMWQERKPQCAIWIEDDSGHYVDTLFVTKTAAKGSFWFAPKEGRPESLPVWYAASNTAVSMNTAGGKSTEEEADSLDAVAGATPKKSVTVSKDVTLDAGKTYVIKVEVNQSFDYDDTFTKKNSGVNGQPSLIYSGQFSPGSTSGEIELTLCGTGSLDGSDGEIHTDMLGLLTTAKDIIAHIFVVY